VLVKDKIIAGRRNKGMSTSQLSEIVGVNKGTINRYESGAIKIIPVENLHKIAEALGYSFEDLVSEDPKYSILCSSSSKNQDLTISASDRKMLEWFHGLPEHIQQSLSAIWEQ